MFRYLAVVKALDLLDIDVDANDVIAGLGHAGTRYQANVARTKNRQSH